MFVRSLIASALSMASATIANREAVASELQIFGIREDRTSAYGSLGGRTMAPYGAKLHAEILREIRRNYLPFRLIAPATVLVIFAVNRRGELAHLTLAQKSRAKPIDDYAMLRRGAPPAGFRRRPPNIPTRSSRSVYR